MSEITIETSSIFTKTLEANTRVICHEGSARASKTISILQYLIMRCLESKVSVTICRARLTWAKATVLPDFLWVLDEHFKSFNPDNFNKSESIYNFPNGSNVAFIGLDEENKLRGRKQDYAYLNECIECEYESYQQIAIRTIKQIIICYNPSAEEHWLYSKVIPRSDCTFIKSTFNDNPFLQKEVRDEILRLEPTEENIRQGTADAVSWAIFGKGERASHKGLIFPDWKIVDEIPDKELWKHEFYGQDFGYSNDPAALVHVIYAKGELWLDELIYEKGLTNIKNPEKPEQVSLQQRYEELGISKKVPIWADSSEPKSIQDLANCGYFIAGADKGPDSINAGIVTLKRFKVNITSRSVNLIKEKNNYKWREDKNKSILDKPIDMWNHGIDATRMAVFMELKHIGDPIPVINPNENKTKLSFLNRKTKSKSESYYR